MKSTNSGRVVLAERDKDFGVSLEQENDLRGGGDGGRVSDLTVAEALRAITLGLLPTLVV